MIKLTLIFIFFLIYIG